MLSKLMRRCLWEEHDCMGTETVLFRHVKFEMLVRYLGGGVE